VQDLVKLSGQQVPVSGVLTANLKVHGTELSPLGQGKVSITHITAYETTGHVGDVKFHRHRR